jgi:O-antigen/teichoic acid export membrane protein
MEKTGRAIIIQLLSWGIAIPIIFPMTALLTRYLGPVQYGEYSFTLSFLAVFALFSGTGMDPLIIRQLSRQKREEWSKTLSYAAGTRLLSTTLSIGAAVLLILMLPVSPEQRNLLLLGSASLLFSFSFNGLRMIYSHGFRAEQQVGTLSLLETTNRVVTAGLVALIVLFHFSLLWACILIIYSDLPFFFILVMMAQRRFGMRVRFSLSRAREYLLGSLPLMGYNALTLIAAQADLLILMALVGPLSVGIYALAGRITNPLFSVALAYVIGLYPLLCRKFEEGHEQFAVVYQEAMRVLALCIIPLAIFVSAEANIIVTLLGGQHFTAAAIAVQLLMWAMVVVFFSQLAVRTCMAANMERLILYVTAASAALNILANLILIPHWQIVGAGVAALLSELVGLCLFTVLLRRHVRLLSTMNMLLRVFLANLPALAFLLWQQHASLLLTAPIALMLTIIGYFATRTLSLKDIHMGMRILYTWRDKGTSKDMNDQPAAILRQSQDTTNGSTTMLPRAQV